MSTKDNPADIGSRSGNAENVQLWWSGPEWLPKGQKWPPDIETKTIPESQAEAKVIREALAVAQVQEDNLDTLLGKLTLWQTLRVCAWIGRFIHNARSTRSNRKKGLLTTEEISKQRILWLKRLQETFNTAERFEEHRLQLNLQPNENGLPECLGRIQGVYPIYVPESHQFAHKLVEEAHNRTLHGGVSLTMAKIHERYWVSRLRRLARKVVKACNGCKRFHATAFINPPPGQLPKDCTEGQNAFQVIGVDFAGPLKFRKKKGQDGKAYLVLYACSLTRGIYNAVMRRFTTSCHTRESTGSSI